MGDDLAASVQRAVMHLDSIGRRAIILIYKDKLTTVQAAAEIGLSPRQFGQVLMSALRTVAACIEHPTPRTRPA